MQLRPLRLLMPWRRRSSRSSSSRRRRRCGIASLLESAQRLRGLPQLALCRRVSTVPSSPSPLVAAAPTLCAPRRQLPHKLHRPRGAVLR
jgi:hypothetical protein